MEPPAEFSGPLKSPSEYQSQAPGFLHGQSIPGFLRRFLTGAKRTQRTLGRFRSEEVILSLPTLNLFSLEGRVAIVTGGNRNIGLGLSRGLAGAGARVLIANQDASSGRAAAARLADEGWDVSSVQADVGDAASCRRMAQTALDRWGRIDILVNNAAVRVDKTALDHTAEDFDWIMGVNVRGILLASQAVYPVMRGRAWGRIINIGSISARKGVWKRTSYSASKAAVAGLTRGLAVEWAGDGITVNALSPGSVATSERPPDEASPRYQAIVDLIPLRRFSWPDDLVGLCVFLASDASAYLTGQDILIDGGWSLTMRPFSQR
jgi:NAD(P)-dependent dehydrogenase (short-subunit alcohol dehydrogenase family)